ncbi:MAG: hypothetical protein AUG14_08985 [Candidatus Rokubacteria bacterium 13_1_20CM_2_68_19]|nr:MAG: hypothetical protein AUG14_08985 [Candidatus Rokubacteria bacterium 13_1_20CM_2_68_19]
MLVLLELVPAENLEVVVPTLTSRDREGEKAILLEKVSVVVGPACPTTKPSECTYATEALTSRSATLYSYERDAFAYAPTLPSVENWSPACKLRVTSGVS